MYRIHTARHIHALCNSINTILLSWLLLLSFSLSAAQASDQFTIRDIVISAESRNGTEARKKAITEGQAKGLRLLLEQHFPDVSISSIEAIETVAPSLVQEMEIINEKISRRDYSAQLSVRFSESLLKSWLDSLGFSSEQRVTEKVLLLPVLHQSKKVFLWEENSWYDAWIKALQQRSSSSLVVPLGELEDVLLVNEATLNTLSLKKISSILKKYGASQAMILQLHEEKGTHGAMTMKLVVQRIGHTHPITVQVEYFRAQGYEGRQQLVGRIMTATEVLLESLSKKKNAEKKVADEVYYTEVVVPVAGLEEWATIQKVLYGLEVFEYIEVTSMSVHEVQLGLHHRSKRLTLVDMLYDQGISMLRQADDRWLLTLTQRSY